MITGELKNKIDSLWDTFASGGLVNPLDVIEQITYLMFIHDLDDLDNKNKKESVMLGVPFKSIFSENVSMILIEIPLFNPISFRIIFIALSDSLNTGTIFFILFKYYYHLIEWLIYTHLQTKLLVELNN